MKLCGFYILGMFHRHFFPSSLVWGYLSRATISFDLWKCYETATDSCVCGWQLRTISSAGAMRTPWPRNRLWAPQVLQSSGVRRSPNPPVAEVKKRPRGFKIGCLLYHSYCWWFRNPAADEVGSLSHYPPGFIHARWLFGISDLSTVCFLIVLKDMPANHVDTVSCKDDCTAEVAKLKEEETTSVEQFEAGQLEGIFFGGKQGGCRLS